MEDSFPLAAPLKFKGNVGPALEANFFIFFPPLYPAVLLRYCTNMKANRAAGERRAVIVEGLDSCQTIELFTSTNFDKSRCPQTGRMPHDPQRGVATAGSCEKRKKKAIQESLKQVL